MANIIQTIGTGFSFVDIPTWRGALPGDLVADGNSYTGLLHMDGGEFTLTATQTFSQNADATHFITLACASGHSIRDNIGTTNAFSYNSSLGVGIKMTTPNVDTIVMQSSFMVIDGIQMKGVGSVNSLVRMNSPSTLLQGSIFAGLTKTAMIDMRASGATVSNNLVDLTSPQGVNVGGIQVAVANGIIVGNTIVQPSDVNIKAVGIAAPSAKVIAQDNAIFGYSTAFTGTNYVGTNNATDSSGAPGTSGNLTLLTYANQFNGITSGAPDYRVTAGADLINAGVDNPLIPVDFARVPRPSGQVTIGAWQFQSAPTSGGATSNVILTGGLSGGIVHLTGGMRG